MIKKPRIWILGISLMLAVIIFLNTGVSAATAVSCNVIKEGTVKIGEQIYKPYCDKTKNPYGIINYFRIVYWTCSNNEPVRVPKQCIGYTSGSRNAFSYCVEDRTGDYCAKPASKVPEEERCINPDATSRSKWIYYTKKSPSKDLAQTFVKSTVTSRTGTATDECKYKNMLTEYYCKADNSPAPSYENILCRNGCEDGACVE